LDYLSGGIWILNILPSRDMAYLKRKQMPKEEVTGDFRTTGFSLFDFRRMP